MENSRIVITKNLPGYTELGYANGAKYLVKSICVDPDADKYETVIDGVQCFIYSKPPRYITAQNLDECLHETLDETQNTIKSNETIMWPVKGSFTVNRGK